jgi:predicted acylesterase/phospholipase RssA
LSRITKIAGRNEKKKEDRPCSRRGFCQEIGYFEFDKAKQIIKIGEQAARRSLPQIRLLG